MLSKIRISFFWILKTVPCTQKFEDLDITFKNFWSEKQRGKEKHTAAEFYNKKSVFIAEFSKIICISVGYLLKK